MPTTAVPSQTDSTDTLIPGAGPAAGGHVSVAISGAADSDVLTGQVVTATPAGGSGYTYTWVATDPAGRDRSSQTLSATNIAAPTFTPELTSGNWTLRVSAVSGSNTAERTVNVRIGDDEGWVRLLDSDFTWAVTNSIITAHTQQGAAIRLTIADTQSRTAAQADYGHYQLPNESDGFLVATKIQFDSPNDGSERWACFGLYYDPSTPTTHGFAVGIVKNSIAMAARRKHLAQNTQSEDGTNNATADHATLDIAMSLGGEVIRGSMALLDADGDSILENFSVTDVQNVTDGHYYATLYAGKQDLTGVAGTMDVTPFVRRYAAG